MRGRRTYKYGTRQYSADCIISLIMGIGAWLLFLAAVLKSLMTAGMAPVLYGYILIVSVVCGLWGTIFAVISWHAEEGGIGMKRFAIMLNLVLLVIEGVLLFSHFS